MKGKGIVMAGVLATVLALAGCSSPDPEPARSAIAAVPGIQGARVVISHPGAPWNTESLITLYVTDDSSDAITADVRAALSALGGGPLAQNPVTVFVVKGEPADYPDVDDELRGRVNELGPVADALGVPDRGKGQMLILRTDEVERLAAAR